MNFFTTYVICHLRGNDHRFVSDSAFTIIGARRIRIDDHYREMADDILVKKFIPVLRSGIFKTSLPLYIKDAWAWI